MIPRPIRMLALLPIALAPLGAVLVVSAACELAVNLNPALVDAGPMSDVLDCGICADVSPDADYDAADVSIYGIQPPDAGRGARD